METKKIASTALWLVIMVALVGLCRFIQYQINMYYSQITPEQFTDDSAYSKLQLQSTISSIVNIVCVAVAILILYRIFRVWKSKRER